jgi:N utilization substance protein B
MIHKKTTARDCAIQFLYQCECEKIFHFSDAHFNNFAKNFKLEATVAKYTSELVKGILNNQTELDEIIQKSSKNWTLDRMPTTDRCVLRIACLEMMGKDIPTKVIINEAIELAKKYGTKNSGSFVNGVLDHLYQNIQKEKK